MEAKEKALFIHTTKIELTHTQIRPAKKRNPINR